MATAQNRSSIPDKPRRFPLARVAWLTLLALVLTLAFIGYLTPAMRVQWANFVSMCGF